MRITQGTFCRHVFLMGALVLVAGFHASLGFAEGEEPAPDDSRIVTIRRSLVPFRTPSTVAGPNLATPADLIAKEGDAVWNVDPGDERLAWLPFQEPATADSVFAPDLLVEMIQTALPRIFEEEAGVSIDVTERDILEVRVPNRYAARVEAVVDRIIADISPSASVTAVLARTVPEPRLRAMGMAKLWPGRWTRVFFQKDEIPSVVGFNIEIAQEANVADPIVANLVEGCECYVRMHVGESRSLYEYWVADLDHVATERIDLSEVRNAPESSGLGVLNPARTAIDRAFGCVVVPNGKRVDHEIVWQHQGRTQRLQLQITGVATAAPVDLTNVEDVTVRAIRSGALLEPLAFDSRVLQDDDTWRLEAYSALDTNEDEVPSLSLSRLEGMGLTQMRGPAHLVDRLRAAWRTQEQSLQQAVMSVQVWHVPESAFRSAVTSNQIVMGQAVSGEILATFRDQGGGVFQAIRMPVMRGIRGGFRVGQSVPGLIDMNAEVAQQSGALVPTTWALFEGVFADLLVDGGRSGLDVTMGGEAVWADPKAGTMELVFRPPISLTGKSAREEKTAERRRVQLPVLSGGSSSFDSTVSVKPGSWVVLHASVRGDDVTLVLVGAQ